MMDSKMPGKTLNLDEDAKVALARCYAYLLSLKKQDVKGKDDRAIHPDPSLEGDTPEKKSSARAIVS